MNQNRSFHRLWSAPQARSIWLYSSLMHYFFFGRKSNPREVLQTDSLFYKREPELSVAGLQYLILNKMLQWLGEQITRQTQQHWLIAVTWLHRHKYSSPGFDAEKSSNETAIHEYIEFVDKRFSLILLTEYFDESLILLKRLMNWKLAGRWSLSVAMSPGWSAFEVIYAQIYLHVGIIYVNTIPSSLSSTE